jgi:hypothetical protein
MSASRSASRSQFTYTPAQLKDFAPKHRSVSSTAEKDVERAEDR